MRYCVASVVPTDQPCRPKQWLCSPNSQPPNRTCPNRPSADFPIAARLPVPTLLFPPSLYLPNKRVVPAGGISSISKRTPCGVLPLAPRTSNKPKNKKNPNPQSKCQTPMSCYAYPHHASCMYTRASIRWQPKRSKRGGTVPLYAYAWEVGVLPKVMIVRGCSGCWSLTFDERAVVSGKSNPPTPGTGPSSIQSVGGVLYDSFDKRLSPFPSNLLADCVNQVHCPKVKYLRLRAGNGAVQGRH